MFEKNFWKNLCLDQGRWDETHFGGSVLQRTIAATRLGQ
jgi:hypothetical protein